MIFIIYVQILYNQIYIILSIFLLCSAHES
nr:MAG TPA: hypothetical protein [Caudoviricetes sp.]